MSSKGTILAVDDSLTMRKLIESRLTGEGYEVILGATGEDCLKFALERKPDLILLDYMLPDKDGTEVCQSLLSNPATAGVPVLLFSGNSSAIRQLYEDLNNVADYITKPFAPDVLLAVVDRLVLQSRRQAAGGDAPGAVLPVPGGGSAHLLDRVNRVLALLERPARAGGARPPRAPRRPSAVVKPPEYFVRRLKTVLGRHLRECAEQLADVPSPEMAKLEGKLRRRALSAQSMEVLGRNLLKSLGLPSGESDVFRCPVSLVPLDAVLRHLHATNVTGELRVELPGEYVEIFFDAGDIAFITSNDPRSYCFGATFDFSVLGNDAVAAAVRTQEESSIPFFLGLAMDGNLPPDAKLPELLQAQGERALRRAFHAHNAVCGFQPMMKLPMTVRDHRTDFDFEQLLLACYRSVEDWFTIETGLPGSERTLQAHLGVAAERLGLDEHELAILKLADGTRTTRDILAASGLGTYAASRILFRLAKLGVVIPGATRGTRAPATATAHGDEQAISSDGAGVRSPS